MKALQLQTDALYEKWCHIETLYTEYAKRLNLSRHSMDILYLIYKMQRNEIQQCTQKAICEEFDLPKQTVNTIISGFVKDGFVEFCESPEDRRHKILQLTSQGGEFCTEIFQRLIQAEVRAFGKIPERERKQLISLLDQYKDALTKELK